MKSFLLIDSSYPINTRNIRFLNSLKKYFPNASVEFIGWNRKGREILEEDREMPVYNEISELGNRKAKLLGLWGFYKFIRKYNKQMKPQILIASHWDNLLLTVLLANQNQRIIYENLDIPTSTNKWVLKALHLIEKWCLRKVDLMTVASRFYVPLYSDYRGKVIIIENKLPNDVPQITDYHLCTNSQASNKVLNIVFLGNIRYVEILNNLIEAIRDDSSLFLHIYGDGPFYDELQSFAKDIANVRLYGRYSYGDITQIYSQADLIWAVYPADDYNVKYAISNKFHESLYYAVPAIYASGTELASFVSQNRIGFEVDCYSVQEIRNLFNKITKENLLEIHGELLHQRIQEKKWDEEFIPFIDYCKNS